MANSIFSRGAALAGSQTVTTAGTAVALVASGDTIWHSVTIVAKGNNGGQVYVGGSDVDSNTNRGLDANDVLNMQPHLAHYIDLSDIYIDVDTNGEGVDFWAVK